MDFLISNEGLSKFKIRFTRVSYNTCKYLYESLKSEVNYLRQQLDRKDDQLKSKDDLLRNFQVLLKQEQDARLLLKEKFKEQQYKPKSFWKINKAGSSPCLIIYLYIV
ncbi:MAG: hypothetical protein A2Y23_07285 [Clostridiales bacterium GWB2_37_7]|nr:MAG: hypothetical protein A2Y23_07285 [Clostridiales bacterium GWB2_37_7]